MAKKTIEIELVKTEAGYRRALKQVSNFFDQPPADMREVLGSRQRVHDILQKKRKLSLEHVRALHDKLLIPADVLIEAF